jgi:hypothetical protein
MFRSASPSRVVIRSRTPGEAAQDGARDELIDRSNGEVDERQPLEAALRNGLAVDTNTMMALAERKARLLDHRAGNDDFADLACDIGYDLGAMHDPAQHVHFVQIVIRGRDIVVEIHQADGGPVQIGKQGLECRPTGEGNKFITIQRHDKVPGIIIARAFDEARHGRALIENSIVVPAQHQRQSFVLQFAQDDRGLIRAAVVENVKTIEKCSVVPNKRLDDIALVPDRGDCSETHSSYTSTHESKWRIATNFRDPPRLPRSLRRAL